MEFFLREYAARSILPHLNTAAKNTNNIHSNHYNHGIINTVTAMNDGSSISNKSFIINSSTEDSISVIGAGSSSDNNLYFIQPQHELLHDVLSNLGSVGNSVGVAIQNEDYSAYINNDSVISPSSSPTIHLLASLASVTTTTISSITHQIKQQTEETFHEFMKNDSLATYSCDGESQSISALNSSLMGTDDDSGGGGGGGDGSESALSSVYFKTAVYLLYIPIFVFALLGNGTVCYIVQSTPRMRTVTNYFIGNLAVGDILMSLFCVPSSFISIFILGYWPFGMALCHFVNYSQAVSVLVSAYTLVAISIDRYIAIMWPLRPRITKRYAKFIIAGIWIIALATAFPIPIVSKLVQPGEWHVNCERYVCQEDWSSTEQNYYYTLALLTLQFLVPLSVLIFTYTRIAVAVWGKRPPGEAENSRDQRMARSKRKNSFRPNQTKNFGLSRPAELQSEPE